MATIKSYTDLKQSRKLAEILPLESADYYRATDAGVVVTTSYITYCGEERCVPAYKGAVPCWSLAALFSVLPVIIGDVLSKNSLRLNIDKSETNFNVWYDNLDSGMVEEGLDIIKSNAVDACYEMILKLNELKML